MTDVGPDVGIAVTGVGIHPFGRFDASATEMGVAAVKMALDESGSSRIDAAYCGTAYGGIATGHKVLGQLGLTGPPIVDVEAGCASGGAALELAATAIRAGRHERVLVFGTEKMPKGLIRSTFFDEWQERAGLTPAPAYFALRARRLMIDTGLGVEDLARVVVKNRRHGIHNPDAMFRKEVSVEEVLASPVVCDPLHLFMLCSPNQGAAAVVVERAGAGRPGGPPPVILRATVLRSHLPGSVLSEATPLAGDDESVTPPTTLAAMQAYDEAGVGPADLDVVECQDTDAARELLTWQELGLCRPGDQVAALEEGTFELGGRLPVNPSGGLLSKGEPLGASALGQIVEITRQLRGECGARQVAGARVGLAHVIGRGANACVTILSR